MTFRGARDWIKLGLAATVEATGVGAVARALRTAAAGPHIHLLGYHRVVDRIDADGPVNPALCITTEAFRLQMEQLRERFIVLPLEYAMRAVAGEIELAHDAVAVTFDDGYRDVLLRAEPILRELGIPAAVFVPSGFADAGGRARRLPHDRLYAAVWAAARASRTFAAAEPADAVDELIREQPAAALERLIGQLEAAFGAVPLDDGGEVLAPAELRLLADRGWEIGAHTVRHAVLTHESPTTMRRELAACKADLERWSGRACRYFAYCNGYHSPSLVAELRRAGFEGAVTTCDRPNRVGDGDPFRVGRKVLWEGHVRGPDGRISPALSAAHLHDLFGALGLTTPVDGAVAPAQNLEPSQPTEVELAY
jgi:peptidoglycan/xylan/chitin deacetylase (PgdA/CDA1 family)